MQKSLFFCLSLILLLTKTGARHIVGKTFAQVLKISNIMLGGSLLKGLDPEGIPN